VEAAGPSENALSGLQVTDLDSTMRKKFGVDDWVPGGVVVTGVQANSSAETRGFMQGDIIEMVCVRRASPEQLSSVGELTRLATALKPDQGVALLVRRGLANRFIYLPPLK
jgi:S1-C subfamily serine protease